MTSSCDDFNFIFGRWIGHNHKLIDPIDPHCTEWVNFDATDEASPILEGLGHIHRMYAPVIPSGEPFEGFTLRLYEPTTSTWRIWWSSTRSPGILEPPLIGRMIDGHGVFECDEVLGGQPAKVRFEWESDSVMPQWQQSFSFDAGVTWRLNWTMVFERIVA
jgi:hypothetical protein